MSKKRIISLILLFFVCFSFIYKIPNFYNGKVTNEIQSYLGISGDPATLEWVSIYDDPDPSKWDQAYDIAIDSLGNVYSVGYSNGGMIIVKYNSTGDYILNRTWIPGSGYAGAKEVVLDSSNNIYVAGNINNNEDIFLLKYDNDCILQWFRVWDGSPNDFLNDMTKDSADNIYLTGSTENLSLGTSDMVVIKYDFSGNQLWNQTWGGLEGETGNSIAIDSSDNIIIGGTTSEGGDLNMILVKYNNLGVLQWDIEWERGAYWERNEGVVIDSSDNIFAAVIDIDNYIPILVKFDNFGNEIWNRTYQGLEFYGFDEMEIDTFDNIYLATTFEYRIFGFAKINKFGDFLWKETWGTADDEFCTSMALNSTEHVYLAGYRSFHSYMTMILVKFKLNPPETPYFIDLEENFVMYEGDITKSLIWTPIEDSMFYDSYWVMQNDTKIIEGDWDGSQISYSNLGGLVPGIYNFTCFVNNTHGKLNSSSVLVTILPNFHAPNIDKNTGDISLNIGISNYIISWHMFDLDGNNNSYRIERNSVIIDSGTWNNDSDLAFTETEILTIGLYNYTCLVDDTSGMENQSSTYITIINHDPTIYNNTVDFSVNIGTSGYFLSWHVIDIDGNSLLYWIERNGSQLVQNSWNNDSDIIYIETESLSAGYYNYTCFVNDSIGALNQSSIMVKVNSFAYFSDVNLPSNNIYEENIDYVFNCTWFDIDGTIDTVLFEFGNSNHTVATNDSGIFTFILNDLSANENGYVFRWHANDSDGAWTSTGWQNFTLNKKGVDLIILFNGTENNYFYDYDPLVNITVINLNSTLGTINLFVDGKLVQQEADDILVNISQYSLGSYNITVMLTDENYTGISMHWLHLSEKIPPEISFELSKFYVNPMEPEYADDVIELICTVNDFSLLSWVYCCDNSSGTFLNHTMVSLGNGNWTYTIDISGLNWDDSFSILFYTEDVWGNIGSNDNFLKLYQISIYDFQSPITSLSFIPFGGPDIVNVSTILSLDGYDGLGSGISTIRYKINDSNWMDYSIPFNLENYDYGYYNLSYYSIDYAGNVEEINSIIIKLVEITDELVRDTPAIPGFDILLIFGIIVLITTFSIWKRIRSNLKCRKL